MKTHIQGFPSIELETIFGIVDLGKFDENSFSLQTIRLPSRANINFNLISLTHSKENTAQPKKIKLKTFLAEIKLWTKKLTWPIFFCHKT